MKIMMKNGEIDMQLNINTILDNDNVLHNICEEYIEITVDDKNIFNQMFEIILNKKAFGLASPQVGISKRAVVWSPVTKIEKYKKYNILVNPEYKKISKRTITIDEKCLSIPYYYNGDISRAYKILVTAKDENFNDLKFVATGMDAVIIQHEVDHLNGKLISDYDSNFNINKLKEIIEKEKSNDN